MTEFTIIPAIDLRAGRVVRLQQGDYGRQTNYDFDAVELATRYRNEGATWLHVVDLDGARAGSLANVRSIDAIARTGLKLQAGGGVRERDDLERLFDAGVDRVVLGSIAIRNSERVLRWLPHYGVEQLTIALDSRELDGVWTLPSAGWTQTEEATLEELATLYANAGLRHLLCTDIDRDGMLAGFNLDLYRQLHALVPSMALQASGGVRSIDDIVAARDAGASAVILGRALLEDRFTLTEALAC
ncbi:MAG: 1-(5-phosphoribosyl)-5-[(5-phosphoribosylamino)methylideneamino]imidazole-4-carboxamide isomerase [Dokdonella sp.]